MLKPRAHLRNLAPYELPGKGTAGDSKLLQLSQNENYVDASPNALAAARDACAASVRYPDPDANELRAAIAALHGLDPQRIVCARGAMELISLLTTVFLEPGASAVTSQYGYMYFRTASEVTGARVVQAPERSMTVDATAMAACVDRTTRMVFVANPGNPTGTLIPQSALIGLRRALPDSVVLVIDEAYAEFVEPERYTRCFELTESGDTVVLRTFSKIYGLAGLRIGWGYCPQQIADLLRVVQQPNGITGPGQAAAVAAIADQTHIQRLRTRTLAIRDEFTQSLRTLGLNPCPSQGNFVLLALDSATAAVDADAHLRRHGIAVRGMNGYGLPNCLRITLGTEPQMERVVHTLKDWMGNR